MSCVSALFLESFRPEVLCIQHPKCPLPGLVLKYSTAVTTELNKLREKADNIEIKSLMNKVRGEKTTRMDTINFEKKLHS